MIYTILYGEIILPPLRKVEPKIATLGKVEQKIATLGNVEPNITYF
jgi:hypothetical protein